MSRDQPLKVIFCFYFVYVRKKHPHTHKEMNIFSVDKDASLNIIKEIISHLKEDDSVSLNEKMNYSDIYGEEEPENVVPFRHKLKVAEVGLCDYAFLSSSRIQDNHEHFLKTVENKYYEITSDVEIHADSEITEENEIELTAYLHNSSAGGDVSYPTFTYYEPLQCWIVMDSFWDSEFGIDCNGQVTILDFSEYFENPTINPSSEEE